MNYKNLLLGALALLALSCSKDEGGDNYVGYQMSAAKFASLTPSNIPSDDTWTITGDVTMTQYEFEDMMLGIAEELGEREISLIFSDETSLGFMAPYLFSEGKPVPLLLDNFVSISAPKVTATENYIFGCCSGLRSISLPLAKTMGELTFYRCTWLNSVNMPKLTNIGRYTFLAATTLETLELPSVTSIDGEYVFMYCYFLKTLKLTSQTLEINDDEVFYGFSNIANCTLYLHYANSDLTNGILLYDTFSGSTFKEIIYVNSAGKVTDANGNIL